MPSCIFSCEESVILPSGELSSNLLKEASSLNDLADLKRHELRVKMTAFPIVKGAKSLDEQLWIYQGALMPDVEGLPKKFLECPLEPIGKLYWNDASNDRRNKVVSKPDE